MAASSSSTRRGGTAKSGKALAQVDRAMLGGQLRHHGEDGGAHLGQFGFGKHWPIRGSRGWGWQAWMATRQKSKCTQCGRSAMMQPWTGMRIATGRWQPWPLRMRLRTISLPSAIVNGCSPSASLRRTSNASWGPAAICSSLPGTPRRSATPAEANMAADACLQAQLKQTGFQHHPALGCNAQGGARGTGLSGPGGAARSAPIAWPANSGRPASCTGNGANRCDLRMMCPRPAGMDDQPHIDWAG